MAEKMTPSQGQDALFELIVQVGEATEAGDNDALHQILNDMGDIVTATGVDVPGIQDSLAALQGENAKIATFGANHDAAMWAGDLSRAHALLEAGVPLDYDNIPGVNAPALDEFSDDEDYTAEVAEDDPQMIQLLAEFAAKSDAGPDIFAEIAEGTPGAIGAAIARGDDLNTPCGEARHTALLAALDAPHRRAEKIERLINAGADARAIHADGDNTLSWAAGYHHPETVTAESEIELMTLLARHHADPNHETEICDWTPLHRAIVQGDAARVAGMLAAGADISATTGPNYEPMKLVGFTPLMLAAPKPDVVRLLLAEGADPTEKDAHGRLPLEVIGAEAKAARARADEADPWTFAHAEALEESRDLIANAISPK